MRCCLDWNSERIASSSRVSSHYEVSQTREQSKAPRADCMNAFIRPLCQYLSSFVVTWPRQALGIPLCQCDGRNHAIELRGEAGRPCMNNPHANASVCRAFPRWLASGA